MRSARQRCQEGFHEAQVDTKQRRLGDAEQLLHGQAVGHLVEDRGDVVGAGHEGHALGPGAVLHVLLDARVEVADAGPGLGHRLAVELEVNLPGIDPQVARGLADAAHAYGLRSVSLRYFNAAGAAFDNPELIVACVVGDGEAETGPLAAAWHSNKFLSPVSDGTVLFPRFHQWHAVRSILDATRRDGAGVDRLATQALAAPALPVSRLPSNPYSTASPRTARSGSSKSRK